MKNFNNDDLRVKFSVYDVLNFVFGGMLLYFAVMTQDITLAIIGLGSILAFAGSKIIVILQLFFNLGFSVILYFRIITTDPLTMMKPIIDWEHQIGASLLAASLVAIIIAELVDPKALKISKTISMVVSMILLFFACRLITFDTETMLYVFIVFAAINSALAAVFSAVAIRIKSSKSLVLR
ncbi:MAG: hypothetical protein GF364_08070 [Candidatus Lokiarchaeota archaeon]|nr:hypothetical protein [Candidatus Lokiarchaeota archaeon]